MNKQARFISVKEGRFPNPDGCFDVRIGREHRPDRHYRAKPRQVELISQIVLAAGGWSVDFDGGAIQLWAIL